MSASLAKAPFHGKSVLFLPLLWEAILVACFGAVIYWTAGKFDLLEKTLELTRKYEHLNLDEVFFVFVFFFMYFFALSLVAVRKWRQAAEANERLAEMNRELKQADREIHQLRGLIPICAKCNRMKDDQGYWRRVEDYIGSRADVDFSPRPVPGLRGAPLSRAGYAQAGPGKADG
jgi:hypothetical protein